jgi:hypothetical protein
MDQYAQFLQMQLEKDKKMADFFKNQKDVKKMQVCLGRIGMIEEELGS